MPFEMDSTISIHAPREGGDGTLVLGLILRRYFNPRPPRGGRHGIAPSAAAGELFQSTPPARGATFTKSRNCVLMSLISIHAPREEGDATGCSGRRMNRLFQSTPPARGATTRRARPRPTTIFQSTPPARGATLATFFPICAKSFQSTPPRRGRPWLGRSALKSALFQSTPPAKGATEGQGLLPG